MEIQFNFTLRTTSFFFRRRMLPFLRRYSQYIINSTNNVIYIWARIKKEWYMKSNLPRQNNRYNVYFLHIVSWALNTLITASFLLIKALRKPILILSIGPAVRVFANGPGDLGSIPGRVIPKTLKMELDTTLLNTQHYKVRFKGKVEQSCEWSSALPYTLV